MILSQFLQPDQDFLQELREYFSSYGTVYACKYCRETNFDYFLVEFADYGKSESNADTKISPSRGVSDQVDRVLLDRPHFFNKQELTVMKSFTLNRTLMNIKFCPTDQPSIVQDAIDVDDDQRFLKFELNFKETRAEKKNAFVSEVDLQNEVVRLRTTMKQMNEEFNIQRRQLEEDCCRQLKKLNEDADRTHRLQQDLEQGTSLTRTHPIESSLFAFQITPSCSPSTTR